MLANSSLKSGEKAALIEEFDKVLGLRLLKKIEKAEHSAEEIAKIEALIEERNSARTAKNFAESDRLRDVLLTLGVVIKDNKDGASWEWK
jgi:cysteinyl-tRNA synthetase